VPQLENGYTRIANEILEALCKVKLSGRELRAVLALIRLTYGWGHKEDQIAYSQFAALTGIARNHIQELFKGLAERNIVVKIRVAPSTVPTTGNRGLKRGVPENGNNEPLTWRFQKDCTRWRKAKGVFPKTGTGCSRKREPPKKAKKSIESTSVLSTEREDPEQLKLESPDLGTPESDYKVFVERFCSAFEKKCNNKYRFGGKKDGAIVKRALKDYSLKKLLEFGHSFFNIRDEFTEKAGFSLTIFDSQLNKLAGGHYGKNQTGSTDTRRGATPTPGKFKGR
jgi:phage replication O-like protein O